MVLQMTGLLGRRVAGLWLNGVNLRLYERKCELKGLGQYNSRHLTLGCVWKKHSSVTGRKTRLSYFIFSSYFCSNFPNRLMRHISPLFWLLLSVAPISAQQPRFALVIGRITARMQSAGTATNIIFLDACRAFPISRGTKSLTKGLAKEPYAVPDLVVAYATAPGNTATVRGENGLSLYTSQLLKHLKTPGLVLETVLKNTRRDVLDKSEGKQRPDETGNLTSDFYFFPGNPPPLTEKKPQIQNPANGQYNHPTLAYGREPTATSTAPSMPAMRVPMTTVHFPPMAAPTTTKMASQTRWTNAQLCFFLNDIAGSISLTPTGKEVAYQGNVIFNLNDHKYGGRICFPGYITDRGSNQSGRRFIPIGGYENYPAGTIGWECAKAYCEWLSQSTGQTYRLPSEAEWEYAARGGNASLPKQAEKQVKEPESKE